MTEAFCLSRYLSQCTPHANGNTLQHIESLEYMGVTFISNVRQNKEADRHVVKSSLVLRELCCSAVA